jgi:hypothetical protein
LLKLKTNFNLDYDFFFIIIIFMTLIFIIAFFQLFRDLKGPICCGERITEVKAALKILHELGLPIVKNIEESLKIQVQSLLRTKLL